MDNNIHNNGSMAECTRCISALLNHYNDVGGTLKANIDAGCVTLSSDDEIYFKVTTEMMMQDNESYYIFNVYDKDTVEQGKYYKFKVSSFFKKMIEDVLYSYIFKHCKGNINYRCNLCVA